MPLRRSAAPSGWTKAAHTGRSGNAAAVVGHAADRCSDRAGPDGEHPGQGPPCWPYRGEFRSSRSARSVRLRHTERTAP